MIFLENFWELFLDAAPWLVLGLVVAGLIKAWIPTDFMTRHLGKGGFWSVIKAALLGAPLPICSCGVIPVAMGIRKNGASKGATVSFLISTPETGVDSVAVSYALLGPFMAIIRPIAAVFSAIVAGNAVGWRQMEGKSDSKEQQLSFAGNSVSCCGGKETVAAPMVQRQATGCCASSTEKPFKIEQKAEQTSCSDGCCDSEKTDEGFLAKTWSGVKYSMTSIFDDIIGWLLIGVAFAALVETFVSPGFLASWGSGIPAMVVMMLIGIPMYICATASTPIAAGLLLAGISPGTVLVFLLAGPATNAATMGVVSKELGKKALFAYLGGVCLSAIAFGLLTDFLVGLLNIDITAQLAANKHLLPHELTLFCAVLMIVLSIRYVGKKAIGYWNKAQ